MAGEEVTQDDAMLQLGEATIRYLRAEFEWRQAIAVARDAGVDRQVIARNAATTQEEMVEILRDLGESA